MDIKSNASSIPDQGNAIYEAVLPIILNQLESPITVDELSKKLNVSKAQMNNWLKKTVEEDDVCKLSRPVRFCIKKI